MVVSSGHAAVEHDQQLIDGQPHRFATVVEVDHPPLAARNESPRFTVDLGDRSAVLALPFPGEEDVVPGDEVTVVVDPEHPEHVIAVTSHEGWYFTWWGDAIFVSLLVALLGGTWFFWAMRVPSRAARASARRAGATHVVELVAVDGTRVSLRDAEGGMWAWTADETAWSGPPNGEMLVVGRLEDGAWPVVAVGRHLHWPGRPVQHATRPPAA